MKKKVNKFIVTVLLLLIILVMSCSCTNNSTQNYNLSNETCIKIFSEQSKELEKNVNNWLSENKVEIIDVQIIYRTTSDSHYPYYTILVYYRGKTK